MADTLDRLTAAFAERYRIDREIGGGWHNDRLPRALFSSAKALARRRRMNASPGRLEKTRGQYSPSGHVPKGPSPGFSRGETSSRER